MVTAVKLLGISGSLRSPSTSLAALTIALEGGAALGAVTELLELNALDLPMFIPGASLSRRIRRLCAPSSGRSTRQTP